MHSCSWGNSPRSRLGPPMPSAFRTRITGRPRSRHRRAEEAAQAIEDLERKSAWITTECVRRRLFFIKEDTQIATCIDGLRRAGLHRARVRVRQGSQQLPNSRESSGSGGANGRLDADFTPVFARNWPMRSRWADIPTPAAVRRSNTKIPEASENETSSCTSDARHIHRHWCRVVLRTASTPGSFENPGLRGSLHIDAVPDERQSHPDARQFRASWPERMSPSRLAARCAAASRTRDRR